jgi:hypothetical protein
MCARKSRGGFHTQHAYRHFCALESPPERVCSLAAYRRFEEAVEDAALHLDFVSSCDQQLA